MKTTDTPTCPIARSAVLIGDEWVMLILRELFQGPQRFDDLQKKTAAATNILTNRLKRLIDADVVSKALYQEHPPRFHYQLTKAGFALFPLVMELIRYGEDWMPCPTSTTFTLLHLDCGKLTRAGQTCSACGQPVTVRNVRMVQGQAES